MNDVFSDLEKDKVPHEILLDYGMEFTDVEAFDGILRDSTIVTTFRLKEIFNTLLSSRITDQRNGFVTPQQFSQNWQNIEHYMNRCTDDCPPPPNYTIGENFKLSPNPVNNGFVTIEVNQGVPWYTVYLSQDPNNGFVLEEAEPPGFTNFSPIVNINVFNLEGILILSFPNTQLQASLDITYLASNNYVVNIGNNQTENHTIIK